MRRQGPCGARSSHKENVGDQIGAAARPRWQGELAQLSSTLTYGLAAYAVGAIVAAAVAASWPKAGPGFLWPGYVVLGATPLVSGSSAGHLAGRAFPSGFVTPPACGLGGFIMTAWAAGPQELGLFVVNGAPFKTVSWPALSVRLAAALLLAGAVVLRRPQGWSAGRSAPTAVTFGASLALATTGLVLTVPLQVDRAGPPAPLCTAGTPAICLRPEDRTHLPEARAVAERMHTLPPSFFILPAGPFYELGIRGAGERDHAGFYILAAGLHSGMRDPELAAGRVLRRYEALHLLAAYAATAAVVTTVELSVSGPDTAAVLVRALLIWTGLALVSGRLFGRNLSWILPVATIFPLTYLGDDARGRTLWWDWTWQSASSVPCWILAAVSTAAGLASFHLTPWHLRALRRRLTGKCPGRAARTSAPSRPVTHTIGEGVGAPATVGCRHGVQEHPPSSRQRCPGTTQFRHRMRRCSGPPRRPVDPDGSKSVTLVIWCTSSPPC